LYASSAHPPALHSFPTRRSSDLKTPKRCSSSITTRPRSLKTTSPEISRCVPITISTPPSRNSCKTFFCSDCERKRLSISRRTGRSEEHTSELQSLAYLVCRLLLE